MFAEQEAIRAPSIKPVIPYITPASTNTIKIVINTFTPDTLAASSFEPTANTGLNYECDAIAACVIGGVSFVGGTGKISGIVIGVLLLQIIFAGLNFLSVSANMLYIIKGVIILVACAIDMRKYLARR